MFFRSTGETPYAAMMARDGTSTEATGSIDGTTDGSAEMLGGGDPWGGGYASDYSTMDFIGSAVGVAGVVAAGGPLDIAIGIGAMGSALGMSSQAAAGIAAGLSSDPAVAEAQLGGLASYGFDVVDIQEVAADWGSGGGYWDPNSGVFYAPPTWNVSNGLEGGM